MKKQKLSFLTLLFSLMTISLNAQDIQEIIKRNIDARGGLTLLEKLKTQIIDAEIDGQMGKIPMTIYVKDEVGFRQEFELMGMKNYMTVFKSEGTLMMPSQGMKSPQKMDDKMLDAMRRNMNVKGDFLNPKSTLRYELHGTEIINGEENFRVAAINENGRPSFMFFSKSSYLKTRETVVNDETGEEITIDFSNYRKTPEGYTMPYSMTTIMGKMNIKMYKINIEIKDQVFKNAK